MNFAPADFNGFVGPTPNIALEYAVKLLSSCPRAVQDVKTPQELFDKTVELEKMLEQHMLDELPGSK
jgi:hypothetical protein